MFPGGAKENANPVLHATLGDGPGGRQRSCRGEAAGAVARYNFAPDGWDDHADDSGDEGSGGASWGGAAAAGRRSAWERSVHLALRDAAAAAAANAGGADGAEVESDAAAGAPLKLLREAGFDLPPPAGRAPPRELTEPPFSPPWSARPAPLPGGGGGGTGAGSAGGRDAIDAEEVFETIRNVQDPEHPLSLEQLGVVKLAHVTVVDLRASPQPEEKDAEDEKDDGIQSGGGSGGGGGGGRAALSTVDVRFTPTIPHCSMATLIGLSLRVKLLRSLPSRFKVTIRIEPGTHASEAAVNRQLDDKERVAAALENDHLRRVVDKCIGNGMGLPV